MLGISWLEALLILTAVLLVFLGLGWAVAALLRRLVRTLRRPRGWDERVLGPDRDRSRKRPDPNAR